MDGPSPRRRLDPSAVPVRLDCNRATLAELATLPGIGPGRAAAVVLHRVRFGPFRRAEDLGRVDGIGPQTLAELLPFVGCAVDEVAAPR